MRFAEPLDLFKKIMIRRHIKLREENALGYYICN